MVREMRCDGPQEVKERGVTGLRREEEKSCLMEP